MQETIVKKMFVIESFLSLKKVQVLDSHVFHDKKVRKGLQALTKLYIKKMLRKNSTWS